MEQSERVLVVLAHPDLASSRVNQALAEAVRHLDGVIVHDLNAAYPDGVIDVAAEQKLLESADRVVLQYPTFWYSMPSLLKQWFDQVMVRGWAYGTGAPGALEGKGLQVVTSTGGVADAYQPGGFHGWAYDDILIPVRATAHRLGMSWLPPLVIHGVRELSDEQLGECGEEYQRRLSDPGLVAAA